MNVHPLGDQAAAYVRDPQVWEWLAFNGRIPEGLDSERNIRVCITWFLVTCQVEDFSHIDGDHLAADRFIYHVKTPFERWREKAAK